MTLARRLLQLLIGAFSPDSDLFGAILRTYISFERSGLDQGPVLRFCFRLKWANGPWLSNYFPLKTDPGRPTTAIKIYNKRLNHEHDEAGSGL
jgi:hypothetical protein